ncbi:hypothetical protein ACFLSZ_04125 [Candidatus Bipolaricaulota bacterium]
MNKRVMWLLIVVCLVALASVFLAFAQSDTPSNITLEDIYRLLITEDGRNRLDVLEEWIADVDEEVDLIHAVAERMLQDQYGFFEQEEWTLDDLKFQLNTIESMLEDVRDCACP